jgi:hypothetical protein
MNNKFDELAKGLAQSVTRRQALRKFGLGMVGVFAAWVGLRGASARPASKGKCVAQPDLNGGFYYTGACFSQDTCQVVSSPDCPLGYKVHNVTPSGCSTWVGQVGNKNCSF